MSELTLYIFANVGTQRLPRLTGLAKAVEMMLVSVVSWMLLGIPSFEVSTNVLLHTMS